MLGNSDFIDLRASELMKTSLETKYCSAQSQNAFKAFSNHSKLFYLLLYMLYLGFSGSSAGEESACSAGVKWSEVDQSCPTFCDPMDFSLSGSSVHGIFQASVLEWIAISFSRGSSRPRSQTWVSHIAGFTVWATRLHFNSWVGRSPGEGIGYPFQYSWTSLVAQISQVAKNPPAVWETWVQSLGWENHWSRAWQPTPVFLPAESPWTEEPGGLQSMGS